ncbi:MAG: arsenosugar biosynthesis-associated peroxidase-like protein [Coriobacteriaceae bacterium]|nr:arsenosugar biosynthesis-associated peroxidase-like protein [Coriobacteriaceae bacterium]
MTWRERGTMDTYYNPADLANFSGDGIGALSPDLWDKFMGYYGAVFEDGALTAREKSLIALGVAAAVQCPYCIDAYTNALLSQGCDEAQIAEVFHVTNAIRGGAALAHGVQALNIIKSQEF